MARPGETIENPVTRERVTWIETAHSTGGELLAAELYVRPAAAVGLAHRHVRQEERFAVRSGTAGFEVAGERASSSSKASVFGTSAETVPFEKYQPDGVCLGAFGAALPGREAAK